MFIEQKRRKGIERERETDGKKKVTGIKGDGDRDEEIKRETRKSEWRDSFFELSGSQVQSSKKVKSVFRSWSTGVWVPISGLISFSVWSGGVTQIHTPT